MAVLLMVTSGLLTPALWAQEPAAAPGGKTERKEHLQKQLKSILDELDRLKQEEEPRPA
jgi:hypothetical protein